MDITPPWLDSDFLQGVLRDGLRRDSLTVNNLNVRPATKVGDNYLSQIFRVSTSLHSRSKPPEDKTMVIKSMPVGETVENFVNESQFFSKEIYMMTDLLPTFQKILKDAGIKQHKLCADVFYQQIEPNSLIIMEDLCQDGFKSTDRLQGLDLAHTILVLEAVAAFHAASLIVFQKDPSIATRHEGTGFWQKKNEKNLQVLIGNSLDCIAERVEAWGTFPADLPEKILKFKDNAVELLFRITTRNDEELNVLNHGDLWTNNFMFKYEDNVPIEMRFVDFQLQCFGNPLYDLIYFIFSSPNNQIRIKELEFLFRTYYNKLEQNCKLLNYPLKLTFDELLKSFNERIFHAFVLSIVVLPILRAPCDDVLEFGDFFDDSKRSNKMFFTPEYKEAMQDVIPFFIEKGLFD